MHDSGEKKYQASYEHLMEVSEKLKQWGKWGANDQLGTMNYIGEEERKRAAGLVRKGEVYALGLAFDSAGPQRGLFGGRWNPIHTMLATGTDAVNGKQHNPGMEHSVQFADDAVTMPLQCGTQWDALAHVFNRGKMWNGYDATLVGSNGTERNSIVSMSNKMVGRGVLLDMARWAGKDYLEDGTAIDTSDIEACAKQEGLEIRKGDFLIIRTGQMGKCLKENEWGGYAGGDAPGVSFHTLQWIKDSQIASLCTDTWGCEVRPCEIESTYQPWHWVAIPMLGLSVGEIFYLEELGDACAADGVYEFMFVAAPLPITGAVGSPINPQAIK